MEGRIGIIGGSGFYRVEGIKNVKSVTIKTPFGSPSDAYITGSLSGQDVVFLSRHGRGHRILPAELNYCANIYGMKKLGVDRIISVSACGSLRKDIRPMDIVIPDQFVDRTNGARRMTFFGDGIVAHIAFSDPVCPILAKELYKAGKAVGANMHAGGTYINMEGPQFSTRAESELYRSWGMDVIGMTNIGEARVAREAEICYATMACVTDYDCWYLDENVEHVSVDLIIQNLLKNVDTSKKILKKVLPVLPAERRCLCANALKDAIMTSPDVMPAKTRKKLKLIIGRYVK
jgi:5'-methylthioadenosine phosphorylase